MKQSEKTSGSQAVNLTLSLAQPVGDGSIGNGKQDEPSSLPEGFGGIHRACYVTAHASGWETGYQQGYQAGFGDGRRQGSDNAVAPVAVENNVGNSTSGMRKPRLFGLPCAKCGRWFFSDEARCPHCQTPRVAAAEPPPAPRY